MEKKLNNSFDTLKNLSVLFPAMGTKPPPVISISERIFVLASITQARSFSEIWAHRRHLMRAKIRLACSKFHYRRWFGLHKSSVLTLPSEFDGKVRTGQYSHRGHHVPVKRPPQNKFTADGGVLNKLMQPKYIAFPNYPSNSVSFTRALRVTNWLQKKKSVLFSQTYPEKKRLQ